MKKLLLLSVMAFVGLSASAQFKSQPVGIPQTNTKMNVAKMPQSQRSFQALAPQTGLAKRNYAPTSRKFTFDAAKIQPVTRAQRVSAAQSPIANQTKDFGKGKMQSHRMTNLQPTLTLLPQTSGKSKAPRRSRAFAESYTGMGVDFDSNKSVQWTMTSAKAEFVSVETGEKEVVDVLVDVIPTPDFLSGIYPNGLPIIYTVDDDSIVTIKPQSVAQYEDEESGATIYVTLCAANSDDGSITMKLGENGKPTFVEGNWIMLCEFEGVEFDEEFGDGDAYLGFDELIVNIAYYFRVETVIEKEYNGHGVDYFENVPADWVMQRGTTILDDEETHFFINMTPMLEMFSMVYPDGVDVEYTQEGNVITVKPQLLGSMSDGAGGTEYVILCSGTSENGNIVLTEGADGSLTTIKNESIIIGAWSTNKFDPTFSTYLGGYSYIDNVKYRLPDAPAEAPDDVACEPNELILFAGLGYSGYSYNDNLAIMGAYAPTTFRNLTMGTATSFDWLVKETDEDENETTLTGKNRDFSIYAKGGAVYEDFSLTAYNGDAASKPYNWGTGHCLNYEETAPNYEAIHVYAGESANSFEFPDGTFAVMTRQNQDYELTFYVNWATPDFVEKYDIPSMSTIYSYQGKPATPLFLTGVTLPFVSFNANDDFNLHLKLCKCKRSATGNLTLGDVIAEGDATIENVIDDYDLTAVEFTELYVEDEFGMSEVLDYLFIEDEFVIVIEGWDNGTFSGVLGSQKYNFNENTSTWFKQTGEDRLRSYSGGWPMLFIGLLDATYGYLHTDDPTEVVFNKDGGVSSIHVDPMYYNIDEETGEPTYLLDIESILEDGEEVDEVPEWLTIEVANEDYTTATKTDDEGYEYEYFVNGIDYDLVFTAEALPEGVENRTAQIVFYQTGAKLTLTVTQNVEGDGIRAIVEKTPVKNARIFNMAGQAVGNNYKGIVLKGDKKVIVK